MTLTRRAARQLIALTIALVAAATALGWLSAVDGWGGSDAPHSTPAGLLWGAGTGLAVSATIAVHHSVRVFFGRTPEGEPLVESRTPEQRQAIRTVAELTFPDATSIFAVVAVISAFSGGLVARALPAVGLVAVLAIFTVRLRAARASSA